MPSRRANGSGSVFQRGDGMWVAQVSRWDESKGRSVPVRKYSKNREGARAELKKLLDNTTPTIDPKMKLVDYLTAWQETTLPQLGLAQSTVEAYSGDILWVLTPTLGETRLARFTPDEAERWLARLDKARTRRGEPLAQATKRRAFAALSRALDTAVRDGVLEANPLREVRRPRAGAKTEVRSMTADEVDKALSAVSGRRVEPLTVFVAYTGVRLSEALAARWPDIGEDRVLIRGTKSKSAVRSVPLLPEAAAALKTWKAKQRRERVALGAGWQAGDLVFTTGTGKPYTEGGARRDLVAALKRAKLPTSRPFHTFRHSMATRLLNRGVPMPVVSQILGHSSIRITVDTYGHIEPAITADAMATALGSKK